MLKKSITQVIILFTVGICCISLTVSELKAQANECATNPDSVSKKIFEDLVVDE